MIAHGYINLSTSPDTSRRSGMKMMISKARTQIHTRTFASIILAGNGSCYTIGYPKETHLKLKSGKISFIETLLSVARPFWHVSQSTAVILPCSVQNIKTIWSLKKKSECDFTRFEFSMIRVISYVVTTPTLHVFSMRQSQRYAAYISWHMHLIRCACEQ